jgi:cysteine desulfuration protein SufE
MTLDAIRADFALLDDWEDRYRYVIELGRSLPPLPDAVRTEANKVRGCASQVWLASTAKSSRPGAAPVLTFQGDSDAHIVRGLIAILFATLFSELGLKEHLTPQRSNGFFSMVERIRGDARELAAA